MRVGSVKTKAGVLCCFTNTPQNHAPAFQRHTASFDVLCILPALPREVRHINIGMDGQAETTPIGQDVIVECPTCGHLKWITITHEVPDE